MPNLATLGEMLVDLRAELGMSLNPAQATQVEPAHKVKMQRVQRMLWQDFAWPQLRERFDVPLAAGQRYYDLPVGLDLERVEEAVVSWAGDWHPLDRGIGAPEWSIYDPEQNERTDPALRWEARPNGQIEVWPLPATDNSQVLRFTGTKALGVFVEPGDTCTLDRDLIVLSAAAEIAKDQGDAQRLAARAKRLYDRLKMGGEMGGARAFSLGGQGERPGRWPTPPRVSRN
jgi:hypothetical protein